MPAKAFPQAKLTASNGAANNYFGLSVAVSGNTVVVATPDVTVGGKAYQGMAYVFTVSNSGWPNMTQVAELTASDGAAYEGYGDAVAISGDTVVVGAPSPPSVATHAKARPTFSPNPFLVGPT